MALELGAGRERAVPARSRESCRLPRVPGSRSWTSMVSGPKCETGRSFSLQQRRDSVPHRCTPRGSDRDRARPRPPRPWALRDGKGGPLSAVVHTGGSGDAPTRPNCAAPRRNATRFLPRSGLQTDNAGGPRQRRLPPRWAAAEHGRRVWVLLLGPHPGSRRHSGSGSRRSAEKTHRSRPGDQITVWPRATPRTMSDATLEGSTAKGAGERPEVILVRTKPGRTICTATPLPRRDSLNPCPKPSMPAFAEP